MFNSGKPTKGAYQSKVASADVEKAIKALRDKLPPEAQKALDALWAEKENKFKKGTSAMALRIMLDKLFDQNVINAECKKAIRPEERELFRAMQELEHTPMLRKQQVEAAKRAVQHAIWGLGDALPEEKRLEFHAVHTLFFMHGILEIITAEDLHRMLGKFYTDNGINKDQQNVNAAERKLFNAVEWLRIVDPIESAEIANLSKSTFLLGLRVRRFWAHLLPYRLKENNDNGTEYITNEFGDSIFHSVKYIQTNVPGLICHLLCPKDNKANPNVRVSFRGTDSLPAVRRDLESHSPGEDSFHRGVATILREIEDMVEERAKSSEKKITLELGGHSLGAADAQRLLVAILRKMVADPNGKLAQHVKSINVSINNSPGISKETCDAGAKAMQEIRRREKENGTTSPLDVNLDVVIVHGDPAPKSGGELVFSKSFEECGVGMNVLAVLLSNSEDSISHAVTAHKAQIFDKTKAGWSVSAKPGVSVFRSLNPMVASVALFTNSDKQNAEKHAMQCKKIQQVLESARTCQGANTEGVLKFLDTLASYFRPLQPKEAGEEDNLNHSHHPGSEE